MTAFLTYLISLMFAILPGSDYDKSNNPKSHYNQYEKTEITDYDINP